MGRSEKPNIIVLILDAMRAASMSVYGYPLQTTPQLERFARENILFRRAFAPATWTIPTHASILSGLYVSQHRIESVEADRRFNEKVVILPEVLRTHGYRTAAFSQNMLFAPRYQLGGFEEFYELDDLIGPRSFARFLDQSTKGRNGLGRQFARYWRKLTAARVMLDAASRWASAADRREPYFLMINVANAHYAWAVPLDILLRQRRVRLRHLMQADLVTLRPWQFNAGKLQVTAAHREAWRGFYDAALAHVDREVARFIARMRQSSGWTNTILTVTSDHGEMLGEDCGIVGHMLTLHDNLIHVPLIVRHPDVRGGVEVEGVVQNMDLYSSVLEWAQLPFDRVHAAQTQRPTLFSAAAVAGSADGLAFAEEDYTDSYDVLRGLLRVNPAADPKMYPRQQVAVHSATHKYIWSDNRPEKFYNLETDRDEQHNLIDSAADADRVVLRRLQDAFLAWREELVIFPPRRVEEEREDDPEALERLRALGYVP